MSPKSLLRHKHAVSSLADMGVGTSFKAVIEDLSAQSVKRVIICSGKVYYDLLEARGDRRDIALVRLEQYYPFPKDELVNAIKGYGSAEIIWCQEEPQNMGAWTFVRSQLEDLKIKVSYVGRPASAATSCGYLYMHNEQQAELVKKALG